MERDGDPPAVAPGRARLRRADHRLEGAGQDTSSIRCPTHGSGWWTRRADRLAVAADRHDFVAHRTDDGLGGTRLLDAARGGGFGVVGLTERHTVVGGAPTPGLVRSTGITGGEWP
ncbi:hypothetical protein AB0N14_36665 [Streptomyces sp. NPDC051104]|uniref:hypothetical protein n=1 Tax=Streptomyces sp. NPDC051104 TaxID=3155044 RepID=UPI003445A10B